MAAAGSRNPFTATTRQPTKLVAIWAAGDPNLTELRKTPNPCCAPAAASGHPPYLGGRDERNRARLGDAGIVAVDVTDDTAVCKP